MPEQDADSDRLYGEWQEFSVGTLVASRRGCRFIDLDAEIVSAAGCSINDIFARDGEQSFRALESSLLEKVLIAGEGSVVATGGGAVISRLNRSLMRSRGVVINLKVTLEQVMTRLKGCDDRPLLCWRRCCRAGRGADE